LYNVSVPSDLVTVLLLHPFTIIHLLVIDWCNMNSVSFYIVQNLEILATAHVSYISSGIVCSFNRKKTVVKPQLVYKES